MTGQFICTKTEPVVQTAQGKLRGFVKDGIYTFHGVKYAEADRFQMPRPVEPWEGIRDAHSYGYVCPLLKQEVPGGEILIPHRYWPMDEHCQNLNIWTSSLDPGARKPVMVWLHGGGFSSGSAIEHVAYEGDHLSAYGDVVVVTLNHRLNVLGYLNLADYGEKYANSGNAGNADMVAALQWIHENISAFGGDPENVTLFGQSGGGMKVWCLMNTPAADGLFQKGIIQSGVINDFMPEKTDGRPIVRAILSELGLGEDEVEKLETVPYAQLAAAYLKVSPELEEKGEYVGNAPMANDWYLGDPRIVGFCEHARTIPVMVGTVFGEFDFGPGVADKWNLETEQIMEMLTKKYGELAPELAEEFGKAYPDKCLADLLSLDPFFRPASIDFIEKKAAHREAPTFSYLFSMEFPYDEGKTAWHCAEIPYVFHNADRVPVCNVPGISDRIEERVCGAWVNFARYGNPSVSSLPAWPACEPGKEAVMILDRECGIRMNFDHELMKLLLATGPRLPFMPDPDGEEEEEVLMLH